jgi:protein-disulfide isomerase
MVRQGRVVLFALVWCTLSVWAAGREAEAVAAVVNGQAITMAEVDAPVTAKLLALEQAAYALRKASLDNLIANRVLGDEASKQGVSRAELRKRLTGTPEIDPAAIEKEYIDNLPVYGSMSGDEARERIQLDMESRARLQAYREALAKLEGAAHIDIRLRAPRLSLSSEDTFMLAGKKTAPVTITVFSDFACPYCKSAASLLEQVADDWPDEVGLVFRHFPLDIHPQAAPAARAAVCASEQGAFRPFHDALFALDGLSPERVRDAATKLHLDMTRFDACVASDSSRATVDRDLQEARQLGIRGTPAVLINGRPLDGPLDRSSVLIAIRNELDDHQHR